MSEEDSELIIHELDIALFPDTVMNIYPFDDIL